MEANHEKFNKWLRAEVAAAFAIGSTVAGLIIYLMSPINQIKTDMAVIQNQIAELKSNDLVHIELELNSTSAKLEEQRKQMNEMNEKLVEVLVILKQR